MPSRIVRRHVLKLASASALLSLLGPVSAARAANTLRVGGTGSANEMWKVLERAFQKLHPGNELVVIPGLGSTGGIKAANDSAVDVSISARHLKPAESNQLNEISFARSPFVIATSHSNPGALAVSDVARMIADPQAKWHDGLPVRVILRPSVETDTEIMGRLFPGAKEAIESARKRSDVPIGINDQDNATLAETIPGSLIGISLTQLQLEKRRLRTVDLDGKAASLANLENGSYPFGRELNLVFAKTPSFPAEKFVAFLKSTEGAKAIRDCGCQPLI